MNDQHTKNIFSLPSSLKKFLAGFFGFVFLILIILSGHQVFAQFANFTLEVSPESPGPRVQTIVIVRSYSFDTNQAFFSWTLNGKLTQEGKAKDSFSLTTGDAGSQSIIRVAVVTGNGERLEKTLVLRIADVDLLWEANTYVPSWYKGRALIAPGAYVKIFALPNFTRGGQKISRENLIYEWSLNNETAPERSGLGKYLFGLQTDETQQGEYNIEVKISTGDGLMSAKKDLILTTGEPAVLFYEEHPLEGPEYQRALSGFNVSSGKDIKIDAEPYYFPKKDLGNLAFIWQVNGNTVQKTGRPNIFTFSSNEGISGVLSVELIIQNIQNIFQKVSSKFNINVQ